MTEKVICEEERTGKSETGKEIKELLRGKNLSWLIICAAGLTAADLLLSVFLKGYTEIRAAVWLLCGGLALALLWHRLCGHLKLPERLKRPVEFVIPEDI